MSRANTTKERGPRERATEIGVPALSDEELVALLLGTGTAGLPVTQVATALLSETGGLASMTKLGASAIADHTGVGPVKALRLAAALEIGARAARERARARPKLATSREVAREMAPRIGALDHEEMWVLSLDGQNGLRAARCVAMGGLHGCAVRARDILRAALRDAASGMVLVHNHPSGDPTPSAEDVSMTRAVAAAGEVVGVDLLDHVVIAGERHVSLLDLGLMVG
ncbi:MAG: DNA repair protein RadC [Polyangiaceae bacterium]